MDQELKSKWIAALRSGKFKQGEGALCRDGAYCCLGVLCEVAGRDDDWREWSLNPFMNGAYGMSYEEAAEYANMNDGGKSFAEIADHIGANL